jgi:GNAT superfamily N-acetyltransferase
MKDIVARELRPEELEQGLGVRNEIFPPISSEDWKRRGPLTASIAFDGDEAVGFIPLALREFKLAPGVIITAAFEHAVGTREDYRGRGVGTKMIEAASCFLKGKADALFVYRGDERSQAYNFYAKTGHVDLHYMRHFISDNSIARQCQGVKISSRICEILELEEELLHLFEETYSSYGGFPSRYKGYWQESLKPFNYLTRRMEVYLLHLWEEGRLTGYLLAGKRRNVQSSDERLYVLEMASPGHDVRRMKLLLESAAFLSAEKGLKGLDVFVGDFNPFHEVLMNLGFIPGPRRRQIMSLSFDTKALFDKAWKDRFSLPGIELKVWTPQQEFTLLEPEGQIHRSVTLEMKEETLTRWVMGRCDFKARVREGTITIVNGNHIIIDSIAKAIPLRNWEYHDIDFI